MQDLVAAGYLRGIPLDLPVSLLSLDERSGRAGPKTRVDLGLVQ